jgi:short-subunit dehydrogenase
MISLLMNVVVTGASRGIGFETVKLLAANAGCSIIAIARNAEKLEQLKKECEGLHAASMVFPIVCDLNNEDDIKVLPVKISKYFSSIDILINNAGAIVNKPFLSLTQSDLQHVYQVNVFSVIHLLQNLLPMLELSKRAHVVNISSMGGFQGSSKFAGLSAYSSSKAALACLTECLAEEFKEKNIAFNCLALGAAQTEMLQEAFPGYKAPLSALQMAAFVADFSMKAYHYMNGKIIPVSLSNP